MIRKIHIANFRPIRNENLELGKITVLTRANNSPALNDKYPVEGEFSHFYEAELTYLNPCLN